MHIDPAACFLWSLLLLTMPLDWLLAAALAAAIHEICHLLMLLLLGCKPGKLQIGIAGAKLDVGELSYLQEFFCAAAGPLGSLSLVLLAGSYPQLGVCGLVQGLYNLIPVYPLDGGRMLRCILCSLLQPVWADRLCIGIQCLVPGLLAAVILAYKPLRILYPVLILVCLKAMRGKIPCKPQQLRVQ